MYGAVRLELRGWAWGLYGGLCGARGCGSPLRDAGAAGRCRSGALRPRGGAVLAPSPRCPRAAMADGPAPKRRREEAEAAPGPAAPFPLGSVRLRRLLRDSAREKAAFVHGQVPGGAPSLRLPGAGPSGAAGSRRRVPPRSRLRCCRWSGRRGRRRTPC